MSYQFGFNKEQKLQMRGPTAAGFLNQMPARMQRRRVRPIDQTKIESDTKPRSGSGSGSGSTHLNKNFNTQLIQNVYDALTNDSLKHNHRQDFNQNQNQKNTINNDQDIQINNSIQKLQNKLGPNINSSFNQNQNKNEMDTPKQPHPLLAFSNHESLMIENLKPRDLKTPDKKQEQDQKTQNNLATEDLKKELLNMVQDLQTSINIKIMEMEKNRDSEKKTNLKTVESRFEYLQKKIFEIESKSKNSSEDNQKHDVDSLIQNIWVYGSSLMEGLPLFTSPSVSSSIIDVLKLNENVLLIYPQVKNTHGCWSQCRRVNSDGSITHCWCPIYVQKIPGLIYPSDINVINQESDSQLIPHIGNFHL